MAREQQASGATRWASWTGIVASGLCAVHCMAVPAFSAALLLAGVSLSVQGRLELLLMAGSVLLGAIALFPPVWRGEDPLYFQLALLAGGFFLAAWQGTVFSGMLRQSLTISSSALLLLAHGGNLWRLRAMRGGRDAQLHCPDCTA